MPDDLRKSINDARRAVKGVPGKSLLGKAIYRGLDNCEAAYRCNDSETVKRELDAINQLLTQN